MKDKRKKNTITLSFKYIPPNNSLFILIKEPILDDKFYFYKIKEVDFKDNDFKYLYEFPDIIIINNNLNKFLEEFMSIYEKHNHIESYLIIFSNSYEKLNEKWIPFISNYLGMLKRLFLLGCIFAPFDYNKRDKFFYETFPTDLGSNLKLAFYMQYLTLMKGSDIQKKMKKIVEEILLL